MQSERWLQAKTRKGRANLRVPRPAFLHYDIYAAPSGAIQCDASHTKNRQFRPILRQIWLAVARFLDIITYHGQPQSRKFAIFGQICDSTTLYCVAHAICVTVTPTEAICAPFVSGTGGGFVPPCL